MNFYISVLPQSIESNKSLSVSKSAIIALGGSFCLLFISVVSLVLSAAVSLSSNVSTTCKLDTLGQPQSSYKKALITQIYDLQRLFI